MMSPREWLALIDTAYLQDYIKQGGSSVKFAVGGEETDLHQVSHDLSRMGEEAGYSVVSIDAQKTKIHFVELLFQEIARRIDWDVLAQAFLNGVLKEHGCRQADSPSDMQWKALAAANAREETEFRRDVHAWVEQVVYRDFHMSLEFRLAMMQLCLAQLESNVADADIGLSIKQWLRGELRQISLLKKSLIFRKITRNNARDMLISLAHWIRLTGKTGLIISLDITAFMVKKKRSSVKPSLSYTSSNVLDSYEMLRQFIDGAEEIEGMLMVVLVPSSFLHDERLGVNRYEALRLRILDDVRDKVRQNPFAPMVRLSAEESRPSHEELDPSMYSSPTSPERLEDQRVIESLRSGVPSPKAVRTLGCPQATVKSKFQHLLQEAQDSISQGWTTKGLLIEGGFGTGKSHLLESVRQQALEQQFVCSRIIISKETPLYNPVLMFRAAIESAVIPQKRGEALAEVAGDLNFHSPQYGSFYEWVQRQSGEIDARFAATLFLYERMVNDPELSHRLIRFWAGDPLSDRDIARYLKGCDAPTDYRFDKVPARDMALQRFKFVSRLMVAAGYAGWILFIDEAEIIGRYSFKQRAQSYAELARWMGRLEASSFADPGYRSGLAAVMALTDDFQSAVLEEKGDRNTITEKLQATGSETDLVLARQAEQGMRLIECDRLPLVGPYEQLVEEIYHKIRAVHGAAYSWEPPPVPSIERLSSTRMREYVKGWITEWDLKRLVPDQMVDIELTELKQNYSEDLDLESSSDVHPQPVMASPG